MGFRRCGRRPVDEGGLMAIIVETSGIEGSDAYVAKSDITVNVTVKNTGEVGTYTYVVLWYWDGDPWGYGTWKEITRTLVYLGVGETKTVSLSGHVPRYGRTSIGVSATYCNDNPSGIWVKV